MLPFSSGITQGVNPGENYNRLAGGILANLANIEIYNVMCIFLDQKVIVVCCARNRPFLGATQGRRAGCGFYVSDDYESTMAISSIGCCTTHMVFINVLTTNAGLA